ncbi:MAG: oxidoreductase-like protein [Herbaspirillum sp.]|jgi:phthalate 4,5-cis-dihydrodiol dehydrogenase|nr:oxidoreductase-like protein [Herbaspirillum sp.]
MKTASDAVRIGIVGLGAAGRAFLPAILGHEGFDLVAVAEPVEAVRIDALAGHPAAAYDCLQRMLAHPGLDAIYIASPTDFHPEHVMAACAAGKHVLVEKPMAAQLAQARAMVEAAERAAVVLLVGHSHGYDLPIRKMREIIAGGTLGRVQMVNTWCFTDWIYRPRRAGELDNAQGGGVTYRQGSHQFDIIRLLCGGKTRSVRAKTFNWDPQRSATGAHVAYLDFEDGAAATAVYNGYGRFSSMDLGFNVSEWGYPQPPETRPPPHRSVAAGSPQDELAAKQRRAKNAIPGSAPLQPFFGVTLVSCERGEMRQSPRGLFIYTAEGEQEIVLPADRTPRDLVMDEFYDAITSRALPVHSGRWGLANLEICAAAISSSESGRDVALREQVGLPARG